MSRCCIFSFCDSGVLFCATSDGPAGAISALSTEAIASEDVSLRQEDCRANVMHVVLITVVLDFSGLVLAEAVLGPLDPAGHGEGAP